MFSKLKLNKYLKSMPRYIITFLKLKMKKKNLETSQREMMHYF